MRKIRMFAIMLVIALLLVPGVFAQPEKVGVVVQIIRDDAGNNGISLDTVYASINRVNAAFSPINIELFIVAVRYINSTRFATMDEEDLEDLLYLHNLYATSAINLYFTPTPAFGGLGTLPPSRGNMIGAPNVGSGVVVSNDNANTSTAPHEFGHFFGLFHTYEGRIGIEAPDGSNCGSAGDLLCDTPAEPEPGGGSYWTSECSWIGPTVYNPDPTIFMSRAYVHCRTRFTADQYAVMNNIFQSGERAYLKNIRWVKFTNQIGSGNGGGTLKVGNVTFLSGEFHPFPSSPVTVTTGQERLQTSYKHHDWNAQNSQFKLQLPNFVGTTTTPPQFANFVHLHPVTIRTELIDGGSGGNIRFRDPWYLHSDGTQPDSFFTYESPFSPTGAHNQTSGGVFLGQNPVTTPIYYRVHAPAQPPINNFNWHFIDWKTTGTTQVTQPTSAESPVIFGAANDHVIARYKAHLGSSLATATFSNSQRKYAVDFVPGSQRQAICYESAQQVWLSDDIVSGFEPDVFVSSGTGSFSAPSLLVANGGNPPISGDEQEEGSATLPQVAMVYEKDGATREVWFRDKRPYAWNSPQQLGTESVDTRLVLSRGGTESNPKMLAVWRGSAGLRFTTASFNSVQNTWSWGTAATVTGTQAGAQNPSLSGGVTGSSATPLYLTYDNGSTVSLQKYTTSWLATALTVPASYSMVSSASQVAADTRPSGNSGVHIVWEAFSPFVEPAVPSIMYQAYLENNAWTAADQFVPEGEGFFRPTITYLEDGTLVMAWDDRSSMFQARLPYPNDEGWILEATEDGIIRPNLSHPGWNGPLTSARFVATRTDGPPYAVVLSDEISNRMNRTTRTARIESGREIDVVQRPQSKTDPA